MSDTVVLANLLGFLFSEPGFNCKMLLRIRDFLYLRVAVHRNQIAGISTQKPITNLSLRSLAVCDEFRCTAKLTIGIYARISAMVGRTDKGLFITTGSFTAVAKKEATRDGAPPIDLIDGEQLCEILKTLKLGVNTEKVEWVIVDPDVFKGI